MENQTEYLKRAWDFLLGFGPKVILAAFIFIIGFWFIKKLINFLGPVFVKYGFSQEISSFLTSIIDIALKVVVFFIIVETLGFDTAGFIAVLAAASFAVGLALQGSLGNFAAGIIILFFKPYRIGDWVEIKDKFGKVVDIQIFNTIVLSPGSKHLIIPNGEVINGIVTNFSKEGFIRMEMEVTIPYQESFPRVEKIIMDELKDIALILKNPATEIGIQNFDSHSIIIAVRPYVLPDDYWEVYFEVYRRIKSAFHEHGIKVAYSEGVELGSIGE